MPAGVANHSDHWASSTQRVSDYREPASTENHERTVSLFGTVGWTVSTETGTSTKLDPACPMAAFPFHVGGRWTGNGVVALLDGPRRFSDLRQNPGISSAKVLTETPRDMTHDGLLTRTDHQANPPHVTYEPTGLGRSLLPVIDAKREWSDQHLAGLLAHRQAHPSATGSDAAPTRSSPPR
ncbi:DNA-binding transcriptional regulator, HxlR family [Amycolatopsis rubida]|uniref:DNA-binding transcriptional regulator, HxlR family n=1 Tax=Amycolatopsis rubida TaxID=112413 RepID=A0A1I5GGB3_9PSEU|nr:DNA-binding transcriptional regulator, HxlR family [Amycolatopsis rubida]